MSTMEVLRLTQLGFAWPQQAELLAIEDFSIKAGEHVFLKGPSGSGKTTLLGLIAGVNRAQRGRVELLGQDLGKLRAAQRDQYRVDHSGYIFQQFNLLPFLNVLDNACLPCHFSKRRRQRAGNASQTAKQLLIQLGLSETLFSQRADQLSIGQQQRVACARALIGQPELIIADEPTSALDDDSREAFLALLFEQCRNSGASLLFVSHEQSLAPLFDRSLNLAEINQACGV